MTIEPLSEAFGQNLVTINVTSNGREKTLGGDGIVEQISDSNSDLSRRPNSLNTEIETSDDVATIVAKPDPVLARHRLLNMVNKDDGREAGEYMETIVARDVEQGKCATFKKLENYNEKRSINEPKHTPVSIS